MPRRVTRLTESGQLRLPAAEYVLETETLAVIRTFRSNHDWNPGVPDDAAVAELRGEDTRPFEEHLWEQPPERLDELDLAVIAALGEDGRMPFQGLSCQVGSSESTVDRRVDSLIRRGYLRAADVTLQATTLKRAWTPITVSRPTMEHA